MTTQLQVINIIIIIIIGENTVISQWPHFISITELWVVLNSLVATGWTARSSNPSRGGIFRTCPDRPWDHPASCMLDTRAQAAGVWRQPPTPIYRPV